MNSLLIKTITFIIALLLCSVCLCTACTSDKDCNEDTPVCNTETEKCVRCLEASDCTYDSYCSSNKCQKYSDDELFGEFCNSHDCSQDNDAVVCGKCNDDGSAIWVGVCVNFQCEECSLLETPSNSIAEQHEENGMCFPRSVSGPAGKFKSPQISKDIPGYLVQTSKSIGFLIIGFFFCALLIMQCLTAYKIFRAK
ncbi:hypothetical protein M0813_28069 [Anaeramoeba flamelloides]|uniref:Uncharacterized protein n=1 Tax=Anaeramoeba flamelloides TaxID=1746091 RepID=A0ABQ8XWH4_9EUKA|nr:hypothetical protein M0813_28069 [Anaeramoeba flamelloides]